MQRLGLEVPHGAGQAELRQDLLTGGDGPADIGGRALQVRGDVLGVLIVRGEGQQGPRLLDALGGRPELLAGALERGELLVELLGRAALVGHQVLDPLVVLLGQDQLGLRRPQRGGLGPEAGDPVPHLLLLTLDGPPRLLQGGDRRSDLVVRLLQVGAGRLDAPDHPIDRQPGLLPIQPLLLDQELERLAVELDQQRPPLHVIVVVHQYPHDHVSNPAGDSRRIPGDEGVIGRDVREIGPDPRPAPPGPQHGRQAPGDHQHQPSPRPGAGGSAVRGATTGATPSPACGPCRVACPGETNVRDPVTATSSTPDPSGSAISAAPLPGG